VPRSGGVVLKENKLTFALSKGRLAEKALSLLSKCGVDTAPLIGETRKLELFDGAGRYRFLFVKPSDVPIYVERGVADLGVVGKDTLLEERRDICEMLDLGFGQCRLCVAGYKNREVSGNLRVGTKYVNIAKRFYDSKGMSPDIVRLYGSVELAPIVGLSDVIVDLVESGKTLEANGLSVLEEICTVSARLCVNKVSLKMRKNEIMNLIEKMRDRI